MRRLASLLITLCSVTALAHCEPPASSTPPPAPSETLPVSGLPPVTTVARVVAPDEGRQRPAPTTVAPTTTVVLSAVLPAPAWASWPLWRLTADGVPYYKGRPACTPAQAYTIAAAFANRGASLDTQRWAIYVAGREGGCSYLAVRINRASGDDSHCAFQLNAAPGGPLSPAGVIGSIGWTRANVKASLENCAAAAAALWARCGKGPWIQGDYSCRKPSA